MTGPHVMFLCWGNICRSAMAEAVAREAAASRGVEARFSSSGVSAEESGNPMDARAIDCLLQHGYAPAPHRARRVSGDMLADVDLLVAAEQHHLDMLARRGIDLPETALMTDFDPESAPGSPLPDPWYGGPEDFEHTLAVLERGMPALLRQIDGDTTAS